MTIPSLQGKDQAALQYEHFQLLLVVLSKRGYQVVEPTVRGVVRGNVGTRFSSLPRDQ